MVGALDDGENLVTFDTSTYTYNLLFEAITAARYGNSWISLYCMTFSPAEKCVRYL